MKYGFLILSVLLPVLLLGQDPGEPVPTPEIPFENIIGNQEDDIEDDTYLQQIDFYRHHPLNLNTATEEEISGLKILHDLQVRNFIIYRSLLGNLISVYELQSVPGWDIATIRQLLPYITVSVPTNLTESFLQRWRNGENTVLLRYATLLEKPKGYYSPVSNSSEYYRGNRTSLFLRYKYQFKNLLQVSLLAKKDAGEEFFNGSQKQGFGFYSGHVILRKMGLIRTLIIGDFTINMGQGLMQWQNYAFGKSAAVLSVKKQSPVLLPYNSSGEFNFQRGIGITIGKDKWETTAFVSHRILSGNAEVGMDSEKHITSFNTSGYYRTDSEIADRDNTRQLSYGASVKYSSQGWHIAANLAHYHFSGVLDKRADLYNLYSINGHSWTNAGIDYSYTYRNMHFFGETAIDKNKSVASLNGVLMSLDSKMDISVIYRNINKKYQSLYAAALTENTITSNEKGLYLGVSIRPGSSLRLDAYADLFSFPWLKYRINSPSSGRDFFLQLNYTAGKNIALYSRIHYKRKQQNDADAGTILLPVLFISQLNWRIHADIAINSRSSLSQRTEILWFNPAMNNREEGFLLFAEYSRRFPRGRINTSFRLQYFETSGYNSRIYAYESDLLYTVSIPSFFDMGMRYYINARFNLHQLVKLIAPSARVKIEGCLKWSQTIFHDKLKIGEGLDQLEGNKKTYVKFQFLVLF